MAIITDYPDIASRMKGELKLPRKREPEKPCAICKGIVGMYRCGKCGGSGIEP